MRESILAVTAILALARCDTSAQLSELPNKLVLVSFVDDPASVTLRLGYDDKKDTSCKTLSDELKATLGAETFTVVDLGSKTGGVLGTGYGAECVPGKWTLGKLPAADATTTIKLSDPSGAVEFQAQNVMAQRTIAIKPPGTATLHRGDSVTVQWQPATDMLEDMVVEFVLPACSTLNREVLARSGATRPTGASAATIAANEITFTVPADLPAECNGTTNLDVSSGHTEGVRVGVAKCEGATACVGRVGRYARLAGVTIAP